MWLLDLCNKPRLSFGVPQMEGMVTDLALAREKQQNFDTWREERGKKLAIDLTVTVLTTGFWPTHKCTELLLPREMVEGVETFKEFYEGENKHRCESSLREG